MLEDWLSPEFPTRYLTSQQLYYNTSLAIAEHDDCYLYLSGGLNATDAFLNTTDAFIVGNYDLAEAVYELIYKYAGSGNISQVAACGDFAGCPVVDTETGLNKTGEIGLRYCLGGFNIDQAIWGQ